MMSPADRAISQSVTNSLMTAGVSSQTLTNIHVRAMNGTVILTGQVGTQTEKQRVETQAQQTPGVRSVINQLRIAGSTPSSAGDTGIGGTGTSATGQGTGSGNSGTAPNSSSGSTSGNGTSGTTGSSGTSGAGSGTGTEPR